MAIVASYGFLLLLVVSLLTLSSKLHIIHTLIEKKFYSKTRNAWY